MVGGCAGGFPNAEGCARIGGLVRLSSLAVVVVVETSVTSSFIVGFILAVVIRAIRHTPYCRMDMWM